MHSGFSPGPWRTTWRSSRGVGDPQLVGELGLGDQHAQVRVRDELLQLFAAQRDVERDEDRAQPRGAVQRGQRVDAVGQRDPDRVARLDAEREQ